MRLSQISLALGPIWRRAAISLAEKGFGFGRTSIDLADKPGWVSQISPLGETPWRATGGVASLAEV